MGGLFGGGGGGGGAQAQPVYVAPQKTQVPTAVAEPMSEDERLRRQQMILAGGEAQAGPSDSYGGPAPGEGGAGDSTG